MRFHLHPSVKATRLNDGHGVMLMTANKEVWTFSAPDDRVDLEDGVYLAGSDGPRRTLQIVIHGNARHAPRVVWTFQQTSAATLARPPAAAPAAHAKEEAEAAAVNCAHSHLPRADRWRE